MKKVARIVGLCSKPLQQRYLAASPAERATLDPVIEQESGWMIGKMERKGYRLEGTVCGVYGLFLRGQAQGTVRLESRRAEAT